MNDCVSFFFFTHKLPLPLNAAWGPSPPPLSTTSFIYIFSTRNGRQGAINVHFLTTYINVCSYFKSWDKSNKNQDFFKKMSMFEIVCKIHTRRIFKLSVIQEFTLVMIFK